MKKSIEVFNKYLFSVKIGALRISFHWVRRTT